MEKVLVIGRGAREHALAHKALASGRLEVFVAPGNAGMQPPLQRVPLEENDIAGLRQFIRKEKISYVLVGPELPIARGIYDDLHDLAPVVAPPQRLSFLEASKAKAKHFLNTAGIPTAEAMIFDYTRQAEAEQYLQAASYPLVIKASGLAGGKGVRIVTHAEEAIAFAHGCLSGALFQGAGQTIVVERFLMGEERSVFVLSDGKGYVILPVARDYKRLLAGDQGPNTGGMGAYAPAADEKWVSTVRETVLEPTFAALRRAGTPYVGFLYVGLIWVEGEPYVLEYNIRLGDPEAQVVLPLIANNLEELLYYWRIQKLSELKLRTHPVYAVGVVAATAGYPDSPKGGALLTLPALAEGGSRLAEQTYVYWAGVEAAGEGQLRTTGGRTYTVVGLGETLEAGRQRAYAGLEQLPFEDRQYREDIARIPQDVA